MGLPAYLFQRFFFNQAAEWTATEIRYRAIGAIPLQRGHT